MKTSKIIILCTAVILLVILFIFVSGLRKSIKITIDKYELSYHVLPSANFNTLELTTNLQVKIKQGKECIIEYAYEDSLTEQKPFIIIKDNILFIKGDTVVTGSQKINIKITMPAIKKITADQATEISMNFFEADSTMVYLGNNCVFKGNNNTINHMRFNTSGNAQIEVSNPL